MPPRVKRQARDSGTIPGVSIPNLVIRARQPAVALETTLLVHGVPRESAATLCRDLCNDIEVAGAHGALVGVVAGSPVVGMTSPELSLLLDAPHVAKANTGNLGVLMFRRQHAATTVSATMELAAAAGVRVFATGGLGGVHRGIATRADISSDLAALARFPVAVVCSGVKSLLDVESTREMLETLGVPVVGFNTDVFPAFYRRTSGAGVDVSISDVNELASYVEWELTRRGRAVVIANPIDASEEIPEHDWRQWLAEAERVTGNASGRDVTPNVLSALHAVSQGATLKANIALARANARLAGSVAAALRSGLS